VSKYFGNVGVIALVRDKVANWAVNYFGISGSSIFRMILLAQNIDTKVEKQQTYLVKLIGQLVSRVKAQARVSYPFCRGRY